MGCISVDKFAFVFKSVTSCRSFVSPSVPGRC